MCQVQHFFAMFDWTTDSKTCILVTHGVFFATEAEGILQISTTKGKGKMVVQNVTSIQKQIKNFGNVSTIFQYSLFLFRFT